MARTIRIIFIVQIAATLVLLVSVQLLMRLPVDVPAFSDVYYSERGGGSDTISGQVLIKISPYQNAGLLINGNLYRVFQEDTMTVPVQNLDALSLDCSGHVTVEILGTYPENLKFTGQPKQEIKKDIIFTRIFLK